MAITSRFVSLVGFAALHGCTPIVDDVAPPTPVATELAAQFRSYELIDNPGEPVDGRIELSLSGEPLVVILQPQAIRGPMYRARDTGNSTVDVAVTTYTGTVDGSPGSSARLGFDDRGMHGYVALDGTTYFIAPANDHAPSAPLELGVVYTAGDVLAPGETACDHVAASASAIVGTGMATGQVIQLATEADHELVTRLGSARRANHEILHLVNMIDGLYAAQLGVRLSVVHQHTWSVPDPFTTDGAAAALDDFREHWQTQITTVSVQRDVALMFSAHPVLAAGRAYQAGACGPSTNRYAMIGWPDSAPHRVGLAAHQVGHTLGADHASPETCADVMSARPSTEISLCPATRAGIDACFATPGEPIQPAISPRWAPHDVDGDGAADLALFRPTDGTWHVSLPTSPNPLTFAWGLGTDRPYLIDHDGDAKADSAVLRETADQLEWYLRLGDGTSTYYAWGHPSDLAAPADYDGDGRTDIAVYRPSTGTFWIIYSRDNTLSAVQWGLDGDVPVPGDHDGDGRADFVVWRPSTGAWWILPAMPGGAVTSVQWGMQGDVPLAGDFDGDGKHDVGVWRPSTGAWFTLLSSDGETSTATLGATGDIAVPADYDGDGSADPAVFRPSTATWHQLRSSQGPRDLPFGMATDLPLGGRY